jgi:endonuclease/exonuclease/phosphatase family metal-dependent hydrolase
MTSPRAIRIATWNLRWRFGDWNRRAHAIRRVLREAKPDVCALQEVWQSGAGNLAGMLAAEFGMKWSWLPSPDPEHWRARLPHCQAEVGQALLTRWPIRESQGLALAGGAAPGDARRNALLCVVDAPHGGLPVVTTQLSAPPWNSALRCDQVHGLVDWLAVRESESYPVVVAGDMNAEPDSDEMRLICGHKTAPARPGFVLVDAWRYSVQGTVGWTWDRENPSVAATGEPSSRIDYILVGPPHAEGRGRVLTARRIGDAAVDGVWPSDHAGVLAELSADGG